MRVRTLLRVVMSAIIVTLIATETFPENEHGAGELVVPNAADLIDTRLSEQLTSDDLRERQEAFLKLYVMFSAWEDRLIEIAETENEKAEWGESRKMAIGMFQRFGSIKAIPVLVENIEYKAPMVVTEDSLVRGHPCAMALASIGQSAVPAVLMHLRTRRPEEISDHAIELYARLFIQLYGDNEGGPVEAREVVCRTMQRTDKENLRRLYEKLDKMTKDFTSRQ